jgi:hypothetical protein
MAKIVEVIVSEKPVGTGTDDDPQRTLIQLYTRSGKLIAEDDSQVNDRKSWFHADGLQDLLADAPVVDLHQKSA